MERFDRDVRAVDLTFHELPEVLKAVGVDVAANVFNGVVHNLMLKLVQTFVRFQGIGVQGRSGFNVLPNFSL
jgi:hypothetical protein